MAALGTVQIHQVQTGESHVFKTAGHIHRVFCVHMAGGIVSLGQSHTFAFNEVNGGDGRNLQLSHYRSRKFWMIRCPTLPLFSGWNCVA